jgi:hypothetical protein
VAEPAAFLKKQEPLIADVEEDEPLGEDEPQEQEEQPKSNGQAAFSLATASIATPLIIHDPNTNSYDLKLATVKMSHRTEGESESFWYDYKDEDPDAMRENLYAINQSTVPWLEKQFGRMPRGGVLEMQSNFRENYSTRWNGQNLSAATAVLAHAALSGKEPTGVVIGIIDPSGKLQLPVNGWQMIRALTDLPSSRIVLPKSIADLLPNLLTFDELSFIMKHDIFLAEDIDELVAYSKKEPNAQINEALKNFASIREKSTASIGPFVSNQFVRARLETIATQMPDYASVQLLLMQSRGKRPSQLSDKVVAHEIRRAITPLKELEALELWDDGVRRRTHPKAQAAHHVSRAVLDPLDRLIASPDREIYGNALDLANAARTLARAMKKVSERNNEEAPTGFHDKSMHESARAIRNGIPILENKIALILGEPIKKSE